MGVEIEIVPPEMALRLMTCREQVADKWVGALGNISTASSEAALEAEQRGIVVNTSGLTYGSGVARLLVEDDYQLLTGTAVRLGVKELLHEMSMRPSLRATEHWFHQFMLINNANELTHRGCVERLLHNLETQAVHIRAGALVDPLDIKRELMIKTSRISDEMADNLQHCSEENAPYRCNFLEECLLSGFYDDPTTGGEPPPDLGI